MYTFPWVTLLKCINNEQYCYLTLQYNYKSDKTDVIVLGDGDVHVHLSCYYKIIIVHVLLL